MNSPVNLLMTKGRGEIETRLLLGCDQKRNQAISKALEIFSAKFCRQSRPRKISFRVFTRATPSVVHKMVACKPQKYFLSSLLSFRFFRQVKLEPRKPDSLNLRKWLTCAKTKRKVHVWNSLSKSTEFFYSYP